jgi:hypothetical protein
MSKQKKSGLGELTRALGATPLPADTVRRLRQSRAEALEQRARPGAYPWIPLTTFATAASVALIINLAEPVSLAEISADAGAAPFVFSGDDAALVEELEFYRWLESQGYAG